MEKQMYNELSRYTKEFGIENITDLVIAKIIEEVEVGADWREACVLVAYRILERFKNNEIETT